MCKKNSTKVQNSINKSFQKHNLINKNNFFFKLIFRFLFYTSANFQFHQNWFQTKISQFLISRKSRKTFLYEIMFEKV